MGMKISRFNTFAAGFKNIFCPNTPVDNSEDNNRLNILELNDDCLLYIFSFLSFTDQVEFSFACERFRSIADKSLKKHCELNFDEINNSLTDAKKFRRILIAVGPSITNVKADYAGTFIQIIVDFCPNIKSIEFRDFYESFIKSTKSRKELFKEFVKYNKADKQFNKNTCYYLRNLKKLEDLTMTNYRYLTGQYLTKFESLHTLNISETKFTSTNFIELCKSANCIKNLNIVQCPKLKPAAFEALVKFQTELESLSVDPRQTFIIEINKLSYLKSLTIVGTYQNTQLCLTFLERATKLQLNRIAFIEVPILYEYRTHLLRMPTLIDVTLENCLCIADRFLENLAIQSPKLQHFNGSKSEISTEAVIFMVANANAIEKITMDKCIIQNSLFLIRLASVLKTSRDRNVNRTLPLILSIRDAYIIDDFEEKDTIDQNVLKLEL